MYRWEVEKEEWTSRVSATPSTFFFCEPTGVPSLRGDEETIGDGRGEAAADATETLTAPPEHRTSLRRAGECAAPETTDDAGAEEGRSGDAGVGFFGEVGDVASRWLLLSDGVVAL